MREVMNFSWRALVQRVDYLQRGFLDCYKEVLDNRLVGIASCYWSGHLVGRPTILNRHAAWKFLLARVRL